MKLKIRLPRYLLSVSLWNANHNTMRKLTVILGMALASFIQAHAFDQDFYYYLSTKFEGDRRVLDILNDGKNNNQVILAKKGNYSGQLWKLTPAGNGYYRLSTQWRGSGYSLDIVNDGKNNNQIVLAKTGDYSGQLWKITPNDKGYYRLTTQWRGDEYSLDVYNNEGSKSKSLVLAPSGEFSGQYWKITKSSVQTE